MTNDDIDEMIKPYIYESPDHGDTVTRRKFGETDKEDYIVPEDIDLGDSTMTMADVVISTVSPSTSTLTVNTQPFNSMGAISSAVINSNSKSDITFDVNGESRKVSELFASVDAIEKRLQILRPNPELLEKYEMLQSLYDQYKAAEALLYGDDEE
jgi:hypothetical protein